MCILRGWWPTWLTQCLCPRWGISMRSKTFKQSQIFQFLFGEACFFLIKLSCFDNLAGGLKKQEVASAGPLLDARNRQEQEGAASTVGALWVCGYIKHLCQEMSTSLHRCWQPSLWQEAQGYRMTRSEETNHGAGCAIRNEIFSCN